MWIATFQQIFVREIGWAGFSGEEEDFLLISEQIVCPYRKHYSITFKLHSDSTAEDVNIDTAFKAAWAGLLETGRNYIHRRK